MQIGFLTSADLPELTEDDRLLVPHLQQHGIDVVPAIWDSPEIVWKNFACLIIRSTWDYHLRASEFHNWLDERKAEGVTLWNEYDTVRWNMDKQYLFDLEQRGIPIVPTVRVPAGSAALLNEVLLSQQWTDAVVKPSISATAYQTWRTTLKAGHADQHRLDEMAENSDVLIQKYLVEIETDGEWSFMFFDKQFSHAILKRPASGDFRVQSEFGGRVEHTTPSEFLISQAQRAVESLEQRLLYARVDGVVVDGQLLLMELELIEPALFFSFHSLAQRRFADTLLAFMNSESTISPASTGGRDGSS